MKFVALSFAAAVAVAALAATPAAAQSLTVSPGPGNSTGDVIGNPSHAGLVATTPSRLANSRREMNRGRNAPFEVEMSPRRARLHARDLLERADVDCEVADAVVVAYTDTSIPLVEVDCGAAGGLVIADTLPIQATDCLDLAPADADPDEDRYFLTCELPANVARVAAARQSARN